jgi:hypoxanthine phosphoribosyltransferase
MTRLLDGALEIEQVVFDEETIKARVKELAAQIEEDYRGESVIMIGVIRGALYFLTDLTRELDMPVEIDLIGFGSIPNTTNKTGVVNITKDIATDIEGRHVIVVEDVIRTGLTTAYIMSYLEERKPASIALCSMLVNPDRMLMTIPVKYTGFEINDNWLAGYGMDVHEIGRNIPYIVKLARKE